MGLDRKRWEYLKRLRPSLGIRVEPRVGWRPGNKKGPRAAETYRAARRNAMRGISAVVERSGSVTITRFVRRASSMRNKK